MKRAKAFEYNSNPANWEAESRAPVPPRPSCEIDRSLARILPMLSKKQNDPLMRFALAGGAAFALAITAVGISSLSAIPLLTDVLEADVEIDIEIEIEVETPTDAIEQA